MEERIYAQLEAAGGISGFYYKNLVTGETVARGEETPLMAASVIKLAVLADALHQAEEGSVRLDEIFTIRREDKLPSCGALSYLHDWLQVTLEDL